MEQLEERLKEIEIREKRIRNRTIILTALVPVLTIVVSLITTTLTIRSEYNIDKLNYTQEQINLLLKEENDIVSLRHKIRFLIESDLIGSENNKQKIIAALDANLIDEFKSLEEYINGIIAFDNAYRKDTMMMDVDTVTLYYSKSITHFIASLELNPNNMEGHANLGRSYYAIGSLKGSEPFIERAIKEYDKALKIDSTILDVRADKLLALWSLNQDDKGRIEIEYIKSRNWKDLESGRLEDFKNICNDLDVELQFEN